MGFGTHYITSPRWCYTTQDYNECTNKHYHNIDDEKIFPIGFFYLIKTNAKNIESLQITCVHINLRLKFRYHEIFGEMCLLIINIVINITLYVRVSII